MKLEQITRPLIAYSLCFDDVMKTLLSAEAIAYDKAFSFCWEFVYETGKKFSEAISFPCVGFKKYACIGIDVKKVEIDGEEALSTVVAQIKSGKIVPIHYDGYVCPWDKLQKKRRWHNLHTVLAYAVDDKKRCFRVDDPFYEVSDKRIALYTTVGATDGLQYTLSEDGKSYSVTGYIGTNTEITIPDLYQSIPVTIIGESVFYGNYKLKNVSLPNNIIKIESNAFNGCSALIKMVIPNRESISNLHPPISC